MSTGQQARPYMGGGQFLITIGTISYQNTYFIFFFTVFSYVFSLFSPVFRDLQNTPTEYNRIHCILNNTREYTQNTHRIHNVQKRRKVLFAQYSLSRALRNLGSDANTPFLKAHLLGLLILLRLIV